MGYWDNVQEEVEHDKKEEGEQQKKRFSLFTGGMKRDKPDGSVTGEAAKRKKDQHYIDANRFRR